MKGIWKKMKTVLTLNVRSSSILATQKYGNRAQNRKPKTQSVLGSYVYSKDYSNRKGKNCHAELPNKSK